MKYLIISVLTMISLTPVAQTISGRVIDEESHPLAFVTVSVLSTHDGGYTDEEGRFTINITSDGQDDIIVLSHIGYEEVKMTVSRITALPSPIQLKPKNYGLKEVTIKPTAAKDLLIDALSHIKDNYPADFTQNHILYKEYLKQNGSKIRYNFFDYDMYLPSYLAKDSPRIYSTVRKYEMYTENGHPLSTERSSPNRLLKLMYPEKLFNEKALKDNDFEITSTDAVLDSEEYNVIKVRRRPQKSEKSIRLEGKVFINKKDKGIRYIEIHVYNEHPDRFMLVAKLDTLNIIEKIAYTKMEGKYYLDYVNESVFATGNLVGKHMNIFHALSAKVIDRKTNLKMNEIVMKTEVDDIILREKPQDIRGLHSTPDIK